jgi:uncharacterized protein (TIGR03083 family)
MQLTPRYGNDPVVVLDGPPRAIEEAAIRQRRRFGAALATFSAEQWAHPSRCEGWSVRDVIIHLDSTNGFWAYSIASGLRNEPTQFLAAFDPVSSPAQLVAATRDVSTSELFDRFTASTDALVALWASLDDDGWSALAEAPPGHVSVSAVTHHALWDSWVHERDVLLPVGFVPEVEPDEVAACLRYVAALGPALARTRGVNRTGTMAIEATHPDVAFMVDVGDRITLRAGSHAAELVLSGDAVDLLEALSVRRPLEQAIPPDVAWMLSGLVETFDAAQSR